MDQNRAFELLNRISLSHLQYFMERTMNTTSNLLEIIYLILKDEDETLHEYMIKSEVGTIFSLSWVITWFSHVLNDLDDILRLFDLFISTHFLMPIYVTVSILIYKKQDILTIDCDMASMHRYLTNIPAFEAWANRMQELRRTVVGYLVRISASLCAPEAIRKGWT